MLSCQHPLLRVLVVDDHELTRFSLQLALKAQSHIDIVGLASNGKEAIEMVERYHPDVIILDLQMPVMDGLSASTHIKSIDPTTQIIAYSSVEDPQLEVMSQTAPIDVFCKKDTATKDLINIVKQLGSRKVNRFDGHNNRNYNGWREKMNQCRSVAKREERLNVIDQPDKYKNFNTAIYNWVNYIFCMRAFCLLP